MNNKAKKYIASSSKSILVKHNSNFKNQANLSPPKIPLLFHKANTPAPRSARSPQPYPRRRRYLNTLSLSNPRRRTSGVSDTVLSPPPPSPSILAFHASERSRLAARPTLPLRASDVSSGPPSWPRDVSSSVVSASSSSSSVVDERERERLAAYIPVRESIYRDGGGGRGGGNNAAARPANARH